MGEFIDVSAAHDNELENSIMHNSHEEHKLSIRRVEGDWAIKSASKTKVFLGVSCFLQAQWFSSLPQCR